MQLTRRQYEATLELANPEVDFLLYGGAIRGGKTGWLCTTAFQLSRSFANSRTFILRADRPKISTNLLPSVNYFFSQPEVKKHIVGVNKSDLTYTFDNDSIVQLFPESFNQDKDLARFHGLEPNFILFDELPEFQEKTFDKAFERAGAWLNAKPNKWGHKPRPLVVASANPTKNWVKERVYDPWKNGTLPPNWRYVPAKVTDNPFIDPSYLASLKKNMSPLNYQRFVEGDWEYQEAIGNEWLYRFDYSTHVKPVKYDPNKATYLTYDFNVLPYMTLLCAQVEVTHTATYVRFYREYCGKHPDNTARAVTKMWVQDYRSDHRAPVYYCGDSAGESRIPGFGEDKAFNPVRQELDRFIHNESDAVFKRQFFNEYIRSMLNDILAQQLSTSNQIIVEIDEKLCPTLIRDIQETREGDKGGMLKERIKHPITGEMHEKNGHCVDAFKYLFLSVFSELYLTKYHNRQY